MQRGSSQYAQYVPLVLMLLILVLCFLIVRPFLVALFFGGFFAYLLYPFYLFILGKTKREILSSLLVCTIVILVVLLPTAYFAKVLVQESYVLYLLAKQKLAVGIFQDCSNSFCESLQTWGKDPAVSYNVQEIVRRVTDWVVVHSSAFLLKLPFFVLNLFVMFFSMFYFLKEGSRLVLYVKRHIHVQDHAVFDHVLLRMGEVVKGLGYGYVLVALIQGSLGALGFFFFGISSPLFWGLVMGFLSLMPYLGTALIWLPAAVLLFLDGLFQGSSALMVQGVGLAVYSFIFVSSLDNLLKPKLVGAAAKIHPILILVGVLGGVTFFGAPGVVLGPVVLSLGQVLFSAYFLDSEQK